METNNKNIDDYSQNNSVNENVEKVDIATGAESVSADQKSEDTKPLPKIHPNLHPHGRYKMFSNHSSSNDIPGTTTGI